MRKVIMFLMFLMVLPLVHGQVDEFTITELNDKIDALPGTFITQCKAETTAGLNYIEDKVDARLELLPFFISVAAGLGVIAGYLTALVLQFYALGRMQKRINKTQKELLLTLKKLERNREGGI